MKKILIIEDEPKLLEAIKKKLNSHGFETIAATDGESGLEMAMDRNLDLILLDIILPKLDGITLLQKLRSQKIATPVIILTNLNTDQTKELSMQNNASRYLVKTDYSLDDIVSKIKSTLNINE